MRDSPTDVVGLQPYVLLDPLSAAVATSAELSALFDEMWAAQQNALAPFA